MEGITFSHQIELFSPSGNLGAKAYPILLLVFLFAPQAFAGPDSVTFERGKVDGILSRMEAYLENYRAIPCLASGAKRHLRSLLAETQQIHQSFRAQAALDLDRQQFSGIAQCNGTYAGSFNCVAAESKSRAGAAASFTGKLDELYARFSKSYQLHVEHADLYTQKSPTEKCIQQGFEGRKFLEDSAGGLSSEFQSLKTAVYGLSQSYDGYEQTNLKGSAKAKSVAEPPGR